MVLDSNYGSLDKIGWSRSSRTDKGVHSLSTVFGVRLEGLWTRYDKGLGQFEYDIEDDCALLPSKINDKLPPEIRVLAAAPVVQHFDARKACIHRHYEYLVPLSALDNSLYHIDRPAFTRLLNYFVGRHHWHNFGQIENRQKTVPPSTYGRFVKGDPIHDPSSPDYVPPPSDTSAATEGENTSPEESTSLDSSTPSEEPQAEPSLLSVAPRSNGGMAKTSSFDFSALDVKKAAPRPSRPKAQFTEASKFNPRPETFETENTPSNQGIDAQAMSKMTPQEVASLPLEAHLTQDAFYRTISSVAHEELQIEGIPYVKIAMQGDSFLLHQVRRMVGALILAARGTISEEVLIAAIDSPFRILTPRAPPQGLLLRNARFLDLDFRGRDVEPASLFAQYHVYPHLHQRWQLLSSSGEVSDNNLEEKDPWAEIDSSPVISDVRDIIPAFDDWQQWHIQNTKERDLKRAQRKAYYDQKNEEMAQRNRKAYRVTTRESF